MRLSNFHIKLGKLALVLALLLIGGQAWGATYYLRGDGTVTAANKANANSCSAAASTMNLTQHNASTFAAGDTIYLCDTGGEFTDAGMVPPSAGSGTGANSIAYVGVGRPVVSGSSTTSVRTLSVNPGKHYLTFSNIEFKSNKDLSVDIMRVFQANGVIFSYCIFRGNRTLTDNQYAACGARFYTADACAMYNCIVTDNNDSGIYASDAGTLTVRNCIITGNGQMNGVGVGSDKVGTVVDIDYSIIIGNNLLTANQLYTASSGVITDGGHNITTLNPKFTNQKFGTGIIGITIDDFLETQYVTDVTALAAANGFHISVFPIIANTGTPLDAPSIAILQTAYNSGHDIGTHGWSHQTQTLVNKMTIRYVGAAAACAMTISGNTLTTATTGAVDDLSIDLTNASYNTIGELVAYIDGLANYTCTKHADANTYSLSKALADVAAQDIKTAGYLAVATNARVISAEVGDSKTWLEANITGLTVASHAYPSGAYNATLAGLVRDLGFTSARAAETNHVNKTFGLESIYIYGNYGANYTAFVGANEAETRAKTRHVIALVKGLGLYLQIYVHNSTEIPITSLGYIIDEIQRDGSIQILNSKEAATQIRTDHTSADSNLTWTKTYTDVSVYILQAGSPAIGSGVPILTYAEWIAAGGDFAGKNPTNGTFSIGAYQYQKQGSDFPALPIWSGGLKASKSTDAGSYVQP